MGACRVGGKKLPYRFLNMRSREPPPPPPVLLGNPLAAEGPGPVCVSVLRGTLWTHVRKHQ